MKKAQGTYKLRQGGVTLIESLISLLVLCFGILGIVYFQANMLAQSVQSKARMSASRMADELMTLAQVDPANMPCYTLPANAGCTSVDAATRMSEWVTKLNSGVIPGVVTATSTREGARLTISISWVVKKGAPSHSYTTTSLVE